MATPMIGISEATRAWQVSERTLRRRLSQKRIDGAERDVHGQWLIPSNWLDGEFDRALMVDSPPNDVTQVIDLRDTSVADGLAEALVGLTDWTDRITDAEVRAAIANTELKSTSTNLRRTANDLEAQQAERARLEKDLADTTNALTLETDRRERAEERAKRLESQLSEHRAERRSSDADFRREFDRQRNKLTALEAISGRRSRRKLRRFLIETEPGDTAS